MVIAVNILLRNSRLCPCGRMVVLMMLSNTLKEVAANYNVFVMTASQLNGDWAKYTTRNANCLRGAKSLADKIDVGCIGVRCDTDELNKVQDYCMQLGLRQPNIVIDVYKNRRGKMCDVKIFRWFDYGTCRAEDIVVTTQTDYKILNDVPVLEYTQTYEDLRKYE